MESREYHIQRVCDRNYKNKYTWVRSDNGPGNTFQYLQTLDTLSLCIKSIKINAKILGIIPLIIR
jgi:hypothetical protein